MHDKHSANGWDRLAGIRSESDPTEVYNIGLRTSGYLGCSCKSWIFNKSTEAFEEFDRTCKHIRSMLKGTVALADWDPTPFGTQWLANRLAAKVAKTGTK